MEIYIWGVSKVSKTIVWWVNQSDFPPQHYACLGEVPKLPTILTLIWQPNRKDLWKNYGINWIIDVNQEDANVT
jgi:hypothetical protein